MLRPAPLWNQSSDRAQDELLTDDLSIEKGFTTEAGVKTGLRYTLLNSRLFSATKDMHIFFAVHEHTTDNNRGSKRILRDTAK